jgi:hypothetical protein
LITSGYNKLILSTPLIVQKGYMVYFAQNIDGGSVAIDQSGYASFCDIGWKNYLERIDSQYNYRFFLTPLSNFSVYESSFSIYHSFSQAGIYNILFNFPSSSKTFLKTVNITNCK